MMCRLTPSKRTWPDLIREYVSITHCRQTKFPCCVSIDATRRQYSLGATNGWTRLWRGCLSLKNLSRNILVNQDLCPNEALWVTLGKLMHREPNNKKGHQKGVGIQLSANLYKRGWFSDDPGIAWLVGGQTCERHRFLSQAPASGIASGLLRRSSSWPNTSFQRTVRLIPYA